MAAANAIVPERFNGPGAEALPRFLQVDFGLVRRDDGTIDPKLVELQAFASLYGLQVAMAEAYRDAFALPSSLQLYLGGLDDRSYHTLVGDAIVSPLRATLALFADWCGQLRRLIKKGKDADGFFRRVNPKDVTDQIAVCKKQLALVGNMLAIGSKPPSRT